MRENAQKRKQARQFNELDSIVVLKIENLFESRGGNFWHLVYQHMGEKTRLEIPLEIGRPNR
ncbi:MAG TPA: hypothetical protein V6D17_16300 [Candidatus Obscuribacterales bacterium]